MFDVHYSLIFSRPFHSVFKIPIDMCLLILIFYRNASKFQFYEIRGNQITGVRKMVDIDSGTERAISDIGLTRYACYLIAQNGDSRKPEISFAQTYFALQTCDFH